MPIPIARLNTAFPPLPGDVAALQPMNADSIAPERDRTVVLKAADAGWAVKGHAVQLQFITPSVQFCTAACTLLTNPSQSTCIPTWGREQARNRFVRGGLFISRSGATVTGLALIHA
ncbi:hypothetical protein [Lysobacter sp. H23M47]|uniref:hypothetical protein n=1 Tax=Lysobacter sp. H23M47 TaxID=2781024 RepID=UPI00188235AA|nr:hypothetical protein [Lysobacter sp. H23M47]QOW24913.1 hypothetical protein INQ43_02250 [Lysobacter sp. H23M47]